MTRDKIKAEWAKFLSFSHHDVKPVDFAEHIAKLVREECAMTGLNLIEKKNDVFVDNDRTFAIIKFVNAIRDRSGE